MYFFTVHIYRLSNVVIDTSLRGQEPLILHLSLIFSLSNSGHNGIQQEALILNKTLHFCPFYNCAVLDI